MHECVSSYQAIGDTGIFLQNGLIFQENIKNWISFVFTMLPIHIKIKAPHKYMSVCGRGVKPSGLRPALTYNCLIRGSSPDGA